jgi:hypothetical protein
MEENGGMVSCLGFEERKVFSGSVAYQHPVNQLL